MTQAPTYDADFYSDAFIRDPLGHYAAMRDLGEVIYLPRHGNYAAVGFKSVREALRTTDVFRSGEGVAGDDAGCAFLRGNTLASDAPKHQVMRHAMGAPLLPGALEQHRAWIETAAEALVDELCTRGAFDAMRDVARRLPLTVVTELVGLPADGRENMLTWAAASFDILGVQNQRGRAGLETIKEMRQWIATRATAERLRPGSWTARILDLVARDELAAEMAPLLIRDYINPSLDTTISATGELLLQLARRPDQWDEIRRKPALIEPAVEEAVRLATPIRSFSRTLAQDYRLAGVDLPQGARVMMVFASANRDPAHFRDPNTFDVHRPERDHVGFGHGAHACVGMHLARLEMRTLLRACAPRIARFKAGAPTVALNNTIRSYAQLPMSIEPARDGLGRATVSDPNPRADRWIEAVVTGRTQVADTVVALTLEGATRTLPDYDAGAHIDLRLRSDLVRQYSLCGSPSDTGYRIAVHRDPDSRGGSIAVHTDLQPASRVWVSAPRSNFAIDEDAVRHVLIAGGIGVTPLFAMAWRLHVLGRDFRLIYRARSRAAAALADELAASPFAHRVRFAFSDEGGREAGLPELAGCPFGKAVYCCGPVGLMDHVRDAALAAGLAPRQVRTEQFQAQAIATGEPFILKATRSGVTVEVGSGVTMLQALASVGVATPSSCLSGVCGACLTEVVSGLPDHRDQVQTDAEKATNRRVALCCSRALSAELEVDL